MSIYVSRKTKKLILEISRSFGVKPGVIVDELFDLRKTVIKFKLFQSRKQKAKSEK